ncbi:aspartate aminotransferase family protein [Streptomyces griseus]|uniref:Aminotransferase n=2 Tax=Streptomyces TaxID=1883 RepID=B1W194_STRGG|nr:MULTISPECIES: aminotransferase class III-fold pyridoxal phosphate-dependent enzyme [Streptomyces]MYR09397.1 aminotransferase class III-fold pyridoxal phosphate-dependent enzyme [Streptomyces sp. SID724]MYR49941.1 aminotransferase class III-fold pyridoxal phosphate-dependent enzyme [Streptomyces sp. SID4928]EGE41887.1 Acetylornithine transaminase [Streptomyces sp. ACT-1]MYR15567.1 aminotransferase class III-fold pyridoxal phosphate-dependent enzyme [Streptomyces sp. SID724]NEB56561.1 aminotr
MTSAAQPLLTVDDCEQLSTSQVHDLYRSHVNKSQVSLMTSFGFGRELVDHAEGSWIHTRDGRRVLDFTGGVGVLNHGHNHPRILAARRRFQEQRRMEVHKTYFSPYIAALGHNLAQLLPGDLNLSFFPNSGAEAVEGAVKLAYKYHGGRRQRILHADISFHGKLLGSGSLTGSAQNSFAFPGIPGVSSFRYGDLASVREAVAGARDAKGRCDVYAILIEPFSASTMTECSEEFLRGLRELCTEEKIVLIFDEIYTGWGKTGSLFHFMRYPGLVPDVVTTSKSFGGGKSSVSAFIAREPVFRKAYDSLGDAMLQSTSTTYYGFGEETATALEAVNIAVEDDYPARARAIERVLRPGLERLRKQYPDIIADVRGAGALYGIFLDGGPRLLDLAAKIAPGGLARDPLLRTKIITCAVVNAMYHDHDVYMYYTLNGRSPLVAAPSLVAGADEVEIFLDAFDRTLAKGMNRLLTAFLKDKAVSRWAA